MNKTTKAKSPRPGKCRPTTLSLTDEIWEDLRQIEQETGARPSVTVRRLLEQSLRKKKAKQPSPAA